MDSLGVPRYWSTTAQPAATRQTTARARTTTASGKSRWYRWAGALVVGLIVGGISGGVTVPAGAHGVGGPVASNLRSEVVRIEHPIPSVEVTLIEFGQQLEVANGTSLPLAVLWDDGSVARTIPPGQTERWHEHRVHWMGRQPPPMVDTDSDDIQVVMQHWEVPLRLIDSGAVGETPGQPNDGSSEESNEVMLVVGRVRWYPNVSPWPWIATTVAVLVLAGGGISGRLRRQWNQVPRVLAAALLVVGASRGVGVLFFDASRWQEGIWREAPIILGVVLLGIAIIRWKHAPWGTLLAGSLAMVLAAGLVDVQWWAVPLLPSRIPSTFDRAAIAVAIGVGLPLIVLSIRQQLGYSSTSPERAQRAGA